MKSTKKCKHEWVEKVDHRNWEEYYQWTACSKCGKKQTAEDRKLERQLEKLV